MATDATTITPDAPHPHEYISPAPLYRSSTLFRAKPGLTEDQFYHHWYHIHGPLAVPWALHYKVVEYTQFHTSTEHRQALASGKEGHFKQGSPFAALADLYVADYQDFLAAFRDPYYKEVISPDEDKFIDKSQPASGSDGSAGSVNSISTLGLCRSIIRDGKAVVDVPAEVYEKWNEYQARKGEQS